MSTLQHLTIAALPPPPYSLDNKTAAYIALAVVTMLAVYTVMCRTPPNSLPIINPREKFEFTNINRVAHFRSHTRELFLKGRTMYPQQPYRMICPEGEVIVLPTSFVNQIRSLPALDFVGVTNDDSHKHIPGFGAFGLATHTSVVVNRYLNKAINKLTKPISEEASLAVKECLPWGRDWTTIRPSKYILVMVARVSSRVFLGEELCRNKDWIRVSSEYAPVGFGAAAALESWPSSLHPVVHWFLPECRNARAHLSRAQEVLLPFVQERQDLKESAVATRNPVPVYDDAIQWYEDAAKSAYDPAIAQISLSMAAIHTTSDLLQEVMIQLAQHPELFEPLRKEVIKALRANGLTKRALLDLELMDSAIKESQRLKPILLSTMRRVALEDVTLSTGFKICKGQKVMVDDLHMFDSECYESPLEFDAYRFLNMRQVPGKENQAQLASTSIQQMGFGYGLHACPGRFFAANEIKILLCHMLLKFDWRLKEGCVPRTFDIGYAVIRDPSVELEMKTREAEVDIDLL